MRTLPYATRAWTTRRTQSTPKAPVRSVLPRHALVIDAETTTDQTQRLQFAAFRHITRRDATPLRVGGWDCASEGLVYADDLPGDDPDGFELLRVYARQRSADIALDANPTREPDWQLGLYSRTEFAEQWWYRLGVPNGRKPEPAVLVFFNAPFDISRLAAGVTNARSDMLGGFSFQVMANADGSRLSFRPDVVVKQIDSKRALKKNRAVESGQKRIADFAGHYLDLRTAVFALTGFPHSLASACQAYGVSPKTDTELGVVTVEAIDYCRNDVAITAELFAAVVDDFETHPIGLQLTKAYSPASIAKAYLDALGVVPLLGPGGAGASTPPWVLGASMSAFYGGRAECRIRLTSVPVVLVDFTSMYPTVNALMGSWQLITAETITIIDDAQNTRRIQNLIDGLDAEAMGDRRLWPELLTLVEIDPDGDVLPVRAAYREGEWSIGINYFSGDRDGHWYALGDVIGSKILAGRTPRIRRALTITAHGQAEALRRLDLRGEIPVDPIADDFFVTVVEQRQIRKRDFGNTDPAQGFLKVLANSGSYGIYAELTAQDHEATITLYTGSSTQAPRTLRVKRPEEPGRFCYPPLAACITAAARLMLALLGHHVTSAGGHWAFCDTDSMAIVATPNGGELIPCEGGPHKTPDGRSAIRALSHANVTKIRRWFDTLNPYDLQVVPDLLKDEDLAGMCIAISAKRYVIYRECDGQIEILKASEHGLGQLLNPTDPNAPLVKDHTGCRPWIKEVWIAIITSVASGQPLTLPTWARKAAHARLTISSPGLLKPFEAWNRGKPYAEQIKPANFMLTATIHQFGLPPGIQPEQIRLVAPYSRNASTSTEWTNLYDPHGDRLQVTTDRRPSVESAVVVKTYAQVIREYAYHPEAKFIDHSGAPCHRASRGLLSRDHITAGRRVTIGKEANRLDEVDAGVLSPEAATTVYDDGTRTYLRAVILPALAHLSGHEIAHLVGCDPRTIHRIYLGQTPRASLSQRLIELAENQVQASRASRGPD